MTNKFQDDLKIGNEQEIILADKLISTGHFDGYSINDDADYDIKMELKDVSYVDNSKDNTYVTYELKYDMYDNDRVAIELFCLRRGILSGLYSTKADMFVILKNDWYYFFRPEELKKIIKLGNLVFGGDNLDSVLVLLDTKTLTNFAEEKKIKL